MTLKKRPLVEHVAVKSDVLPFLEANMKRLESAVDFIYLDPPHYFGAVKASRKNQHDGWVKEMGKRLSAAKPTLKNTGVIAVSIDDMEQARLRMLMDAIFGEDNFIGMITIDTGNVTNNARLLSSSHEYLLLYAQNLPILMKSGAKWRKKREGLDVLRKQEKRLRLKHGDNFEAMSEELKEWFKSQNLPQRLRQFYLADARGLYTYSDLSAPKNGLNYEVINPNTGKAVAIPTRGWAVSEKTFQSLINADNIIWGGADTHQPLKKLYLKDAPDQVIRSVFSIPSRSPERLLQKILGKDVVFQEPKDLAFMKHVIEVMTPKNAVILDFFGGSGTTGHAVLDLNYEDVESTRKFILCTNEGFKAVMKPRLEAVISGKWVDRQHRPRHANLKMKF